MKSFRYGSIVASAALMKLTLNLFIIVTFGDAADLSKH